MTHCLVDDNDVTMTDADNAGGDSGHAAAAAANGDSSN